MRPDPWNLREQRDSIDDANETAAVRADVEPVTPAEREHWRKHYKRIYRQEQEERERWDREHPEEAARIAERMEAERRQWAAEDPTYRPPTPGLLDDLLGLTEDEDESEDDTDE